MKIFLSSAENGKNARTLMSVPGEKNILVSYYYMRDMKDEKVKELLDTFTTNGDCLMLDSGAHSFLNEKDSLDGGRHGMAQTKKSVTKETPESYFERYKLFVAQWKDYFHFVVELDIDGVVGYPKVQIWQKELANILQDNRKLILVYHNTIPNSFREFERWAVEGFSLGIGGGPPFKVQDVLFSISTKHGSRVHGFAMTKNDYIFRYPYYSVDSSSWNIGQRFGTLMYYDQKTMRIKPFHLGGVRKERDSRVKFIRNVYPKVSRYIDVPLDTFIHSRDHSNIIDGCNIRAYMEQEKALTELWEHRGFFIK